MNLCKLSEYSEKEYDNYLQRYKKLKKDQRDFDEIFGNHIISQDFENFLHQKLISIKLMALLLNVVQN